MRLVLCQVAALSGLLLANGWLRADDEPRRRDIDPAGTFEQLDTDKDGQIAGDEVPEARKRLFERLLRIGDKDHNNTLSQDEFVAGLKEAAERRTGSGRGQGDGPPNPDRMFERLDKNGDGKVTLDEVPDERRERFSHLMDRADKDGDKALTKDELRTAFEQFADRVRGSRPGGEGDGPGRRAGFRPVGEGGFPSPERMGEWLMRLDADKDGKISETEFIEPAKQRFATIDADKDGFVDAEEVKQRVASMAERFRRGLGEPRGKGPGEKPAEAAPSGEPSK